ETTSGRTAYQSTAGRWRSVCRRERVCEERRVGCELRHVIADILARIAGQLAEWRDVLVGNVAEREVHPARAEPGELRRQVERLLVLDALHAVQEVVLPPRPAEDLQRA